MLKSERFVLVPADANLTKLRDVFQDISFNSNMLGD
jgi:hypothetical protein